MNGLYPFHVKQVFDDYALARNTAKSRVVDISQEAQRGLFGIEWVVTSTGAPTVKITIKTSLSGKNFVVPTGMDTIVVSGFGVTSGVGANGKDLYDITNIIPPCKYIEITVTEEDVADEGATINLWLVAG